MGPARRPLEEQLLGSVHVLENALRLPIVDAHPGRRGTHSAHQLRHKVVDLLAGHGTEVTVVLCRAEDARLVIAGLRSLNFVAGVAQSSEAEQTAGLRGRFLASFTHLHGRLAEVGEALVVTIARLHVRQIWQAFVAAHGLA